MARKVLIALALAGALAVRAEPETSSCPEGSVRFEGNASFEDNEKPMHLSKDAVLTIDVAEEVPSNEDPKAPIYTHNVPLDDYKLTSDIKYSFCVDLHGMDSKKISLKAHIVDQAEDDKVEYIGETVVTAGSDSYEADLTLAKVEQGSNAGQPSIHDCHFGQMLDNVTGIAVKVFVKVGVKSLPKPAYLAVTLRETDAETGEREIISIFAGDISSIHEPGKPIPAFLCAKVPISNDSAVYTVDASLHLGWDGFVNMDDDERTPRKGDYVSKKPVELEIISDKQDYSVDLSLRPFEPEE